MKTVFLNPFLSTDLNEKVTSVSFKIGSFDYIAKHANVKTTEIDFDKRIIQINDALDSTASLRELVRAFFIIVAYELNLNAEFPNGKKAHLDDIAMAHLSFLFTHWWDDSTFDWEYNTVTPDEGFGNKALSINCDVYSDADDQEEDIIVSSVGT